MRRRWSILFLSLGAVLLVGATVVRVAVAPALVRFPLNIDETTRYSGTALTYVDRATLLPLPKPIREPLVITRHVQSVGGDFHRAVVRETVTVNTGGTTTVETYQYVLDRRSMQLVDDPRMYAFGNPKNRMHGAGSYRVNFAMGTSADGTYHAFIPEEDTSSTLRLLNPLHVHGNRNIEVIDFTSHLDRPVAPYYREHLAKEMGLPMAVTAAQLVPLLRANGIDVTKALADVGPVLKPAESKLVNDTLAKSVPLQYIFLSNGAVSIEPKTGALIDVHTQEQGLAVKPDLSGASVLQPLLKKYSSIPSVKALADGLAKLATEPPQTAVSYQYVQTLASSLAAAADARTNADKMDLVELRLPLALAALGVVLLGAGGYGTWRRRRSRRNAPDAPTTGEPAAPPSETETPVPPSPVPTGV
jgi:hypothetical protein